MKTNTTYYSNGKLLLTGEYLILDGALALAIPTRFGQYLNIESIDEQKIYWESRDENDEIWFTASFNVPLLPSKTDETIGRILETLLLEAQKLNPDFLHPKGGVKVRTKLNFPKDWGLGSSSTLINNIARWAKIDAYQLLEKTLGGSGYDIACAQHNTPVLYQLKKGGPKIQPIDFYPKFASQLYFVHLNKKQQTHREVQRYQTIKKDIAEGVETLSEITESLLRASALDDFESLLYEHEKLIAGILCLTPIQERLFKDYFGQIKSLGAWGGDFIIATGNEDTPKYFKKKGYKTVFLYDEMSLRKSI